MAKARGYGSDLALLTKGGCGIIQTPYESEACGSGDVHRIFGEISNEYQYHVLFSTQPSHILQGCPLLPSD